LIRELVGAGLLHGDVKTVAGDGLERYTREAVLEADGVAWRDGATVSHDPDVLRGYSQPFDASGGLALLEGNLGRAVIKVSAVKPAHRVIQAPARVFTRQEQVKVAFEAGELDRDVVVVVTHQGPRANGMPELHKLTPLLGVLQDRGHQVALVTDGRMSGASGKVPAAIHLTPEAGAGGPVSRLLDGDLVRLDPLAGRLEALIDDQELHSRTALAMNNPADQWGFGRELFAGFRRTASTAEQGGSVFSYDGDEVDG
jgi:phosphogluconate dehydratase